MKTGIQIQYADGKRYRISIHGIPSFLCVKRIKPKGDSILLPRAEYWLNDIDFYDVVKLYARIETDERTGKFNGAVQLSLFA